MNTSKPKKRAEIAFDKLILIILGIIVLMAALMLIFNSSILGWIKNLPGSEQPQDTIRELTPAEKAVLGYQAIAYLNKDIEISDFGSNKERYLGFCNELFSCSGEKGRTNSAIYFRGTSNKEGTNGKLFIVRKNAFDTQIGDVVEARVKISILAGDYNSLKSESSGTFFPDYSLIEKINGSKYIDGFFYKDNSQLTKELKEYKARIDKLNTGVSKQLEIVFTSKINDKVYAKWDFKNNRPSVFIYPNGNPVTSGSCIGWIVSPAADSCLTSKEITSDIDAADITQIKTILSAVSANDFSKAILDLLKKDNIEITELKKDSSSSVINNYLYGVSYLPSDAELNKAIGDSSSQLAASGASTP
jgi:hypothetical protein